MKKRFAASAMILAMSAATVLSPLTAFAGIEHCHFPGWIWGCLLESDGGAF